MSRARKVCSAIGCPSLAIPGGRFCIPHQKEVRAREWRNPVPRLDGAEWKRRSKRFLREHPFCACGCGGWAEVVDHIKPHKGDPALFWDEGNWQSLTKRHHDQKTAREDGGFGNGRRLANRVNRTGKA